MAGSVNKVMLIGNLGKDPEIRSTQDGKEIAHSTLATSDSWRDKNTGERREKTEWHRVVIFNDGLVSIAKKYLHKGSKVFVEGSLQTRKWTDQSGQEKYTTEVVVQGFGGALTMLDTRNNSGEGSSEYGQSGGNASYSNNNSHSAAPVASKVKEPAHALDDDIPF